MSSTVSCCSLYSATSASDSCSLSSDAGSMLSRKSVSFADSIGEDLCHVKLFCKDLAEYEFEAADDHEESWSSKLWRWQMYPTECSDDGEWYVGGGYDDCEFSLGELDVDTYLEDVLEEEEDEYDEEDEEDKEEEAQLFVVEPPKPAPKSTVIVPTFLSPVDLPSYSEKLQEHGVILETVSVSEEGLIVGCIRLSEAAIEDDNEVIVKYSTDGWKTSDSLRTRRTPDSGFEFEIDASRLRAGDDLEIVAASGDLVDDNRGLKYRFICKNRPKFQPGKSLW